MADLPAVVSEFLDNLFITDTQPAYLLVDESGILTSWGGRLENYGVRNLRAGEPINEQVYFLEGLLPLEQEQLLLPCMQTDSGRPADLHLFSTPEGDCVLLLDASTKEEQQRVMQQKGNELSLNHQQLIKEIQKKDILLHCIVHDLAGPLMGIKGGFELLSKEPISESGKKFLEIGLRQANKQESLIRDILHAFSAEIESHDVFAMDAAKAPDAARSARDTIEALSAAFTLNHVTLQLDPGLDLTRDWRVVGEQSKLDRVISNLIENALRHSPPHSTVTVGVHAEGAKNEIVRLTVDDEGPGVPSDLSSQLFQKFSQGKKGRGKIGLGLYFCRITVEHWGGEVGHEARSQGGSRFWFRLPRATSGRRSIRS
jgi:signal transduction histidine kinase